MNDNFLNKNNSDKATNAFSHAALDILNMTPIKKKVNKIMSFILNFMRTLSKKYNAGTSKNGPQTFGSLKKPVSLQSKRITSVLKIVLIFRKSAIKYITILITAAYIHGFIISSNSVLHFWKISNSNKNITDRYTSIIRNFMFEFEKTKLLTKYGIIEVVSNDNETIK